MSIRSQLDLIIQNAMRKSEEVFRATALEMGNRVIMRTPVDTGALRASFNSDIEPNGDYDLNNVNVSAAESRLSAVAGSLRLDQKFHFGSGLPYAEKIEMGGSQKAPAGMLRITAMEFEGIVRANVNRLR